MSGIDPPLLRRFRYILEILTPTVYARSCRHDHLAAGGLQYHPRRARLAPRLLAQITVTVSITAISTSRRRGCAHLSSAHLAEYVDRMAQYRATDTIPAIVECASAERNRNRRYHSLTMPYTITFALAGQGGRTQCRQEGFEIGATHTVNVALRTLDARIPNSGTYRCPSSSGFRDITRSPYPTVTSACPVLQGSCIPRITRVDVRRPRVVTGNSQRQRGRRTSRDGGCRSDSQ